MARSENLVSLIWQPAKTGACFLISLASKTCYIGNALKLVGLILINYNIKTSNLNLNLKLICGISMMKPRNIFKNDSKLTSVPAI